MANQSKRASEELLQAKPIED
jgi:hypothetical protein